MSSKLRYFVAEEKSYLLILARETRYSMILVSAASLLAQTTSLQAAVF